MHAPLNKNKDLSNVYKIILATGLWHRFSSIHVNLELNWCKTRRLTDPNPSSLRAIEQGLTGPLSPYTDWVSPSWKTGHGDSKGAPHLWIPIWPALARSPRHPDHSRNHTVCVWLWLWGKAAKAMLAEFIQVNVRSKENISTAAVRSGHAHRNSLTCATAMPGPHTSVKYLFTPRCVNKFKSQITTAVR